MPAADSAWPTAQAAHRSHHARWTSARSPELPPAMLRLRRQRADQRRQRRQGNVLLRDPLGRRLPWPRPPGQEPQGRRQSVPGGGQVPFRPLPDSCLRYGAAPPPLSRIEPPSSARPHGRSGVAQASRCIIRRSLIRSVGDAAKQAGQARDGLRRVRSAVPRSTPCFVNNRPLVRWYRYRHRVQRREPEQ